MLNDLFLYCSFLILDALARMFCLFFCFPVFITTPLNFLIDYS